MTIPPVLLQQLEESKGHITEEGNFPSHFRKAILFLLENLSVIEHEDAGYLRRARLALICAKRVIPLISSIGELRESALAIINNALLALAGEFSMSMLELENERFHTKAVDELHNGESALVSVYAAMASFAAVNTVLFDVDFEKVGIDENVLPPDEWDASFYASIAVSGSAVWERKGGYAERSAFWNWYLQTAIPLAWDVETDLGLV